jgi:hypothetical protein
MRSADPFLLLSRDQVLPNPGSPPAPRFPGALQANTAIQLRSVRETGIGPDASYCRPTDRRAHVALSCTAISNLHQTGSQVTPGTADFSRREAKALMIWRVRPDPRGVSPTEVGGPGSCWPR